MIHISEIIPTEIVQTIGWTLLNSLWQGMAIAILLAVALYVFRKKSSHFRYAFSIGAMGLLIISVFATYIIEYQSIIALNEFSSTGFGGDISNEFLLTQIETSHTWLTGFSDYFNQNMPLMVMIWMVGILFMGLRMIGEITYVFHLKNYRTQAVSNSVQKQLEALTNQLKIQKAVKILESLKVKTPMVVGFLKPVILMSVGLASGLSTKQIESILAHELAHIKRHDFAVNLFQSFVEVLLFFNPAVWWISACIRAEREHCCDDLAISVTGDKTTFVKTLAQLEEIRTSNQFALAFAKNRNGVLHRIRRILKKDTTIHGFSRGFWGSLILIMCFFFVAFSEGKIENRELETDFAELIDNEIIIEENDNINSNEMEAADEDVGEEKTDIADEETQYVRDEPGIEKLRNNPLAKFDFGKSNVPVLKASVNENLFVQNRNVSLDTVPKGDRQLELLDRRIKELKERLAGMEKGMKSINRESLEGFRKDRDAEIAAVKRAAEELQKQESFMEKKALAEMKFERERQELKMKEAQSQLALAKEKMAQQKEMNLAKIEAECKRALNKRLMETDERKAKIEANRAEYSDEEFAQIMEECEQAKVQIKMAVEQELAVTKERCEHELRVAELNLQHEAEALELERRQMELQARQFQMEISGQKREMAMAKQEIARELQELENRDLESVKREFEMAQRGLSEEIEMLKMELEILEKERKRRVE